MMPSVAGATRSNSTRRAGRIAGASGTELFGRDVDFREVFALVMA